MEPTKEPVSTEDNRVYLNQATLRSPIAKFPDVKITVFHTLHMSDFEKFIAMFSQTVTISESDVRNPSVYARKVIKFVNAKMSPLRVAFKSREAYLRYIADLSADESYSKTLIKNVLDKQKQVISGNKV